MNAQFMKFASVADQTITDATSRARILATAVAVAVANTLPLPSSPIDNAAEHYIAQVFPQVKRILSSFNENLVFHLPDAIDQVRQLWQLRYQAAHPLARPIYSAQYCFYETLFGVGTFIEEAQYQFVNQFKSEILVLSAVAAEIVAEMTAPHGGDVMPA